MSFSGSGTSSTNNPGLSSEDQKELDELDDDLKDYWNRKNEAIQAGRKRSVKDRLGSRLTSSSPEVDNFETMSIPPPGVSREIPELNQAVLDSLQEVMEEDNEEEEDKATILGEELAAKLSEPKCELMIGVVDLFGVEVCLEIFNKTKEIESKGGMMIKNGERRRTPGGVFLQLLRDYGTDEQEVRVDNQLVKRFFAQTNQSFQRQKRKKKPKSDFKSELEAFKKLNSSKKQPKEQALKPLPDILSCIGQRIEAGTSEKETFVEPDAPPNSVERTVNSYDDDFLHTECDTEDIELF